MSNSLPDVVTVRVEVPRCGFIRRDGHGKVDYISPVPCPFNYGAIDGIVGGDGMPLDALFFGARQQVGALVKTTPRALVRFLDGGEQDDKVVCSHTPLTKWERLQVSLFFWVYARIKRVLNQVRGVRGVTTYRGITNC
jgi:inorganic pyrophosphatase